MKQAQTECQYNFLHLYWTFWALCSYMGASIRRLGAIDKPLNDSTQMHRFSSALLVVSVLAARAETATPAPTNTPAPAAIVSPVRVVLRGGLGMLNGNTTYRIGGYTTLSSGESGVLRFPLSELVFPLGVMTATLEADAALTDRWQARLSLTRSITDDAGSMQDSDWGIWYSEFPWWDDPDSLDIYSESDASLDAFDADLCVSYRLRARGRLDVAVGAGYRTQTFDYNISHLDQWYPSLNDVLGYDIGHDVEPGAVSTYTVTYRMPYLHGAVRFRVDQKLLLLTSVNVAPWVDIEDKDVHLLRSKTTEGNADGSAIWFDLEGRYVFTRNWSVTVSAAYTAISGDGTQEQHFDDGLWGVTELEIESTQTSVTASLTRTF